ncbi:MAG: hypothetical protein SXV54_05620 [Chloroflexota bacterium]|nr:hypothetical protein [Chloroflexota bacterium]
MKKYTRWIVIGVVLLALAAMVAWAFSQETSMTPQASEAWSRGRIIGATSIKRGVSLQPAPDGGVFLVWPNMDDDIQLARIGADGEVLLDHVLPIQTRKARDPQLRVGSDGRLHLLWREQEGQHAGIHHNLLQADGTPVGQSQLISEPRRRISDAPRLIRDAENRFHALWADDAGIHWAMLDDAGGMTVEPTLLIPDGSVPMVQMDATGRLHAIWQYQVRGSSIIIYYAVLDPEQGELGPTEEITEVVISGPLQLEEVAFGLSQDKGYVFWSDYNSRYYRYTFQYASFPVDAPRQRRINLWELRVGAGPLAIAPPDGQQSLLPVALSELVMGAGQEVELQIALITVGQEAAAEQVVTASSQASMKPVLIVDDRSYLHIAWLETGGFGEYNVVYASTAPEVVENYNSLTFIDTLNAAFDGVFRFSTVIVSLVAALATWAMIPLVGLVVYHVVTSEETLDTARSWTVVSATLILEVALGFVFPPRIGVETTWSAARWIVPSVTAVVAITITGGILRRQKDKHLFGTFFLFTGLNCLLQLVLYLLL